MRTKVWLAGFLVGSAIGFSPGAAQAVGLVADSTTGRAILFNAESLQSLGSIALPSAPDACYGDCAITEDRTLAYVSGFGSNVFVIDLTTRPPSPASGTNLIPLSFAG